MGIDIDRLTEAELTGPNRRIAGCLRFPRPMRAHAARLKCCPSVFLPKNKRRHSGGTASPVGGAGAWPDVYAITQTAIEHKAGSFGMPGARRAGRGVARLRYRDIISLRSQLVDLEPAIQGN